MHCWGWLLGVWLLTVACGGGHARPPSPTRQEAASEATDEGVRAKGNSVQAHILALMARGEFAQARVILAEASTAGLITREAATRLSERIALLTTKLGEVPARLQRVANFP